MKELITLIGNHIEFKADISGLWWRVNTQNVSFETLYGDEFMLYFPTNAAPQFLLRLAPCNHLLV